MVNFGGSYSGATATWLRQSYPSLTDGTVASSGVVDAVLEFTGFDEAVAAALDPSCRAGLEAAQRTVDGKFEAGEGPAMKKYFNATNLDGTAMGDEDFMYMLADGYSMIVQYGGKAELCDALEGREDEEAVEGLRSALFNHFGDDFGQDCYYDSECLKVVDGPALGMMGRQNSRSWRFQKCTEVAYLQSRPQGGIRSSLLTLSALESQCKYVFGATPDSGNALLNSARGGAAPDVTNVLSLSYSDDPWTARGGDLGRGAEQGAGGEVKTGREGGEEGDGDVNVVALLAPAEVSSEDVDKVGGDEDEAADLEEVALLAAENHGE